MPTEPGKLLSPRFAAERADALNNCRASIQQAAATQKTTVDFVSLSIEQFWLHDTLMSGGVDGTKAEIARTDNYIASAGHTPDRLSGLRAGRCTLQRRLAQLEGSPIAADALDGTLSPLSVGGQTPPWKQQGKDARIIASNGKSAIDCVKLVTLTKNDSTMGGGGRVLSNQCGGPVEITWCYSPGDCDPGRVGNSWTLGVGRSWPVSAEKEIRWAACHGANTAAFVKDSQGLRYYCSAPLGKKR